MNRIGPATQPSKAVVPTLQQPTTTLDQKHTDLAVVGVITLPKEDIEKLLRNQVPQQSTTINVQINNTIINNYNGPPRQAQNLGHQGESRDGSHQSSNDCVGESGNRGQASWRGRCALSSQFNPKNSTKDSKWLRRQSQQHSTCQSSPNFNTRQASSRNHSSPS